MHRQLPSQPNLEQLKKQAKDLLKLHQSGDPDANARVQESHPRLSGESACSLSDAQLVIARELGFKSWPDLKQRLDPGPLPPPWKQLRAAIDDDDARKVTTVLERHRELIDQPLHEGEDGYFNQRHTALPYAAQGGRVRVVRYLAATYPQLLHRPDHKGCTPINTLVHALATGCESLSPARLEIYHFLKSIGAEPDLANAAKANDLDRVRELLGRGQDPSGPALGSKGDELITAADAGHAEIVKLFLAHAVPEPETAFNALGRALLVNHWDVIRLLQPLVPKERLSEYLCGCCEFLNLEGVEYLLRHGADPNIQFDPKQPRSFPLLIALDTYGRKPHRGKLIETLINAGARQWEPSPQMAIHRSRPDLLREYLDSDPELVHRQFDDTVYPGGRDLKGGTLLHFTAEFYELACAKLLLERGADLNARAAVDAQGLGGHTPIFHVAASFQHVGLSMLRYFIEAGADLTMEATLRCSRLGCVEPEGPQKVTPLRWARWHDHEWPMGSMNEEIKVLREAGGLE